MESIVAGGDLLGYKAGAESLRKAGFIGDFHKWGPSIGYRMLQGVCFFKS